MITIVEIWLTREAYSGNQACQEYKLKYYEQYNKIKHAVSLKGVNLGVDVVFSNAIILIVLLLVDIALEIHAYCFFRIIIFSYLPMSWSRQSLLDHITVQLAPRAADELWFGEDQVRKPLILYVHIMSCMFSCGM